jgi:hypothetical protein
MSCNVCKRGCQSQDPNSAGSGVLEPPESHRNIIEHMWEDGSQQEKEDQYDGTILLKFGRLVVLVDAHSPNDLAGLEEM